MNAACVRPLKDSLRPQAYMLADIHAAMPARQLVTNLDTRVELMCAKNCVMPVTVNHDESGNAWICSPLTTYWRYAAEELARYGGAIWYKPLIGIFNVLGYFLKYARIDQAVAINNWMVSTNIYPSLEKFPLTEMIDLARERWPHHAIWFRSLNMEHNADWLTALQALGFTLIPSRQVYLYEDIAASEVRHTALKRDMKLLRTTALTRLSKEPLSYSDYARIAQLYRLLYLDKYSLLNPQYTERFMHDWHKAGLLYFDGFRDDDGELQAIVGIFQQGNTLTAPIVGYNTALPQSLGLYRLLMAGVFDHAKKKGVKVNLSAGAAHFKRLRGGKPAIEYSAVMANHLPARTRKAISLLSWITTSIGVPIMERFKL
jgi:hypothetical protein